MSCKEQINPVEMVLRAVERQETTDLQLVHSLRAALRSLKHRSVRAMWQISIQSFSTNKEIKLTCCAEFL